MSYTAAVITVSDLGSQGKRIDTSGPAVCAMLEGAGFSVVHTAIVPDEQEKIREATLSVLDREIRAIPVAMWVEGLKITPRAMLSRAVAGTRGSSLILNLPGSEKAAKENLSAVIGALEHAMHMIAAEGH